MNAPLLLALLAPIFQEPASEAVVEPVTVDPAAATPVQASETPTSPEALRARVNKMRMNLLLGGDRVRQAESEAASFYEDKLGLVEERMDQIRADSTEKNTSYQLALDRTLNEESGELRTQAMREASILRRELDALDVESGRLEQKRDSLSQAVSGIRARDQERQALVAKLETSSDFDAGPLPFASIGLAPSLPVEAAASPFEDAGLIEDLLQRDPRAARKVLFESDPQGYWNRFPLRPPSVPLRAALDFPLPDLPRQR